jgi:hypothetical protein
VSRRRVVANSEYSENDAQEAPAPCPHCGIDLLPVSVAARRLDVEVKTLSRWARRHDFPVVQLATSGRVYVFWSEVEEWSRRHRAVRRIQ